jgi:MFS family permease
MSDTLLDEATPAADRAPLRHDRRVALIVAVLASMVVGLDSSVVTTALPAIRTELGGGLVVQQWTVDAYLVTLGSLILVAGSLSDVFGRVRIVTWGLVVFGLASLACAVAPTGEMLVVGGRQSSLTGPMVPAVQRQGRKAARRHRRSPTAKSPSRPQSQPSPPQSRPRAVPQ